MFTKHEGVPTNSEIEIVQDQQKEYKIIGSFLRRKGVKLFAYDDKLKKVYQVDIAYKELIQLVPSMNGLVPDYINAMKADINSNHTHFEAVNIKTAKNRVKRWKEGRVKDLCNLRFPNNLKSLL